MTSDDYDDYDDYDEYDEYDDEYRRPVLKIAGGVAVVVLLAIGGFFLLRDSSGDQTIQEASDTSSPSTESAREGGTDPNASDSAAVSTDSVPTSDATTDSLDASADTTNRSSAPAVTRAATTTAPAREPVSTTAAPTTTPATTTTAKATTTTTTSTTTAAAESPSYPILPDGTPQPIVVIYDTDSITLTGVVPSTKDQERLEALAVANSNFPDATLISLLTIDPTVPIGVGVRVIELNSARFPPASAEILPEHALQLDRVVQILDLLPNVTVTVIGHADQRGDPGKNFQLSQERAVAVTNYLAFNGISPDRLSARAVGQDDLLSVADDDAALALNRRTEFTFYGLLIE